MPNVKTQTPIAWAANLFALVRKGSGGGATSELTALGSAAAANVGDFEPVVTLATSSSGTPSLALGDNRTFLRLTHASPVLTVPLQVTVAFPDGFTVWGVMTSGGSITIPSGGTINGVNNATVEVGAEADGAGFTLRRIGTNAWSLVLGASGWQTLPTGTVLPALASAILAATPGLLIVTPEQLNASLAMDTVTAVSNVIPINGGTSVRRVCTITADAMIGEAVALKNQAVDLRVIANGSGIDITAHSSYTLGNWGDGVTSLAVANGKSALFRLTRFGDDILCTFLGLAGAAAAPTFTATGGTITDSGGYRYHTFTASGTFTVTAGSRTDVEALIVGGGASGGAFRAGGGGGGGVRTVSGKTANAGTGTYPVTVGAGGAAQTSDASTGNTGGNSSVFGETSLGGGGGGQGTTAGGTGGSGGGGGGAASGGGGAGSGTGGQGNNAGAGSVSATTSERHGGGGGGAGAVGTAATTGNAGAGGTGVQHSWPTPTYYGAGGGGGSTTAAAAGGTGGGGAGGTGNGTAGSGVGAGGGGSGSSGSVSGAGATGRVVIRYPL